MVAVSGFTDTALVMHFREDIAEGGGSDSAGGADLSDGERLCGLLEDGQHALVG